MAVTLTTQSRHPLTAAVGAGLLLGERLTPLGLVGGVLLVVGIIVGRVAPTMAVGSQRPT